MKKFPPLPITDLLVEAKQHSVVCLGRKNIFQHVARTVARQQHNNMLLVGHRGVGKSTVIHGFAHAALTNGEVTSVPYLQLDTSAAIRVIRHAPTFEAGLDHLEAAFTSLPPCVFVIDDADALLDVIPDSATFDDVFASFIQSADKRLILILEEELFPHVHQRYDRSLKTFDTLELSEVSRTVCARIVRERGSMIGRIHNVRIEAKALDAVMTGSDRVFPHRSQPDRSLRFLDEICAAATAQTNSLVTSSLVEEIVAQRLGLPAHTLTDRRQAKIAQLSHKLAEQVIGQTAATNMVANVVKRSLLGLKNPNRPLGSFLLLGPSGVGKTELAKVLAQEVYSHDHALLRIDMSEYADAHTVARLIGAPPGYVGYEAGGQLTNPVKKQPFSLILLDEIEKADPAIFDIFLQVLDDGRLTDGQGQTVDFTNTIIIATSNIGITTIVGEATRGQDVTGPEFLRSHMMPLLRERFRVEFLNRFEGIVVCKPLEINDLVAIAHLEIKKLQARLSHHKLHFVMSDQDIRSLIQRVYDPHLGARPLRRALEERIEQAVANHVVTQTI